MSLFEQVGGQGRLKVAVDIFYRRVLADELLAPWFVDVDVERLIAHQRAFLSLAMDGPDLFSGRSMESAHRGLEITDAAFDAIVEHLAYALLDTGLDREAVASVVARVSALRGQVVATAE